MKINGELDQLLGAAYLALLSIPFDTATRVRMQGALSAVRDEIAELRDIDPETVQTEFEKFISAVNH